ncbi:MAG TPA: FxLD family lanthipeptide [Actinokineospora sp.]|nr:FxLD family lanthipeptide [Actinokineospora sp.]
MTLAIAAPDTLSVEFIDDAEFALDMRVVESTTRLAVLMCSTSDGCGSTCSGSACATSSNDPY